jgi:hypothetical protein
MRGNPFYLVLSFVFLPTFFNCPAQEVSRLPNAPFTAVLTTLVSSNGGKQTTTTSIVARRSDGSTYARLVNTDGPSGEKSTKLGIATIEDTAQHRAVTVFTGYRAFTIDQEPSLNPRVRPANYVELYMSEPRPGVGTKTAQGRCESVTLGERKIQGVDTFGSSLNCPGVTSEKWYSPVLDLALETKTHHTTDNTDGETTFTEVRLGEPDPAFFEIPAGFTESERRK